MWAKSQDNVHKPIFLKRKESRSGSHRGPSAYQHSALPLGHTGSHYRQEAILTYIHTEGQWTQKQVALSAEPVPKAGTITKFLVNRPARADQRPVVLGPRPIQLPGYTAGHSWTQVPGDGSACLPAAYNPFPPMPASVMRARAASNSVNYSFLELKRFSLTAYDG